MAPIHWLADALKYVAGIVAVAVLTIFAEEMLGPKPRVVFTAWKKRFGRLFHDDPVKGILQMRLDLASAAPEEEVGETVQTVLRSLSITDVSRQADMIRASARQGRTSIQIRIVPVHLASEEETGDADRVESLSIEMTCDLSYKRFNDTLADVGALADKLFAAFAREGILVDDKSRAFAIDMSNLPELAGFFAVLRTKSFTAFVKDGEARLDYSDRHLNVRGPLDSGTLRVIRDAILFGF